jgi:hypothetical protein
MAFPGDPEGATRSPQGRAGRVGHLRSVALGPGAHGRGRRSHYAGRSSATKISSLSSSMEELHRRVTAMAEGAMDRGDEDMAHELIAVERALGGALRRLQRYTPR